MALTVEYYNGNLQEWDNFMLNNSINGTFLQSRKFIEYHPQGRFKDCSLCVRKGSELVGTLLACDVEDEGKRTFFAHKGSTYGGICVAENIYNATAIAELVDKLQVFLTSEGFAKVYLKQTPWIYHRKNADLIDYFLAKNGFRVYNELNYFMQIDRYREDVLSQFSASTRRDYRYSLKNGLQFRQLNTKEEIKQYYDVLLKNLNKLDLHAVHTLEDLYDLKFNRFEREIEFYGVYLKDKIIAGSMLFLFADNVLHTQYLSSDEDYLKLFPMNFLIANLIELAVKKDMRKFSFGICTEDRGKYLNLGLSRFKEGFGAEFCINRSYEKEFYL